MQEENEPKFKENEEQVKKMVERYGTSSLWVNVELHLTYDEMITYFGEQCEDYEPLCANCSNWVSWQKTGKATIMMERSDLTKIIFEN
jgi:hypothetical protein